MPALRAVIMATLLACACPAADPPPALKVMSYNIRYGTAKDGENHWDKRKEFLAETVAAFDPDLLGTQETLASQKKFLADKLPAHEAFGVGRDDGQDKGEMAALFYRKDRFEKLAGGHFWLSAKPDEPGSKGWDAALPRLASWVKLKDLKANGKPILFVNTHFDHVGKTARLEAAKLLRDRIVALGEGCSIVATGDFNAGEGSDPYKAMFDPRGTEQSPVVDSYRTANPKREPDEGTTTPFKPEPSKGARIDWIGVSRDFTTESAKIVRPAKDGRTASDHFPVTAVLKR